LPCPCISCWLFGFRYTQNWKIHIITVFHVPSHFSSTGNSFIAVFHWSILLSIMK
jgi:hypothetical protein